MSDRPICNPDDVLGKYLAWILEVKRRAANGENIDKEMRAIERIDETI